MIVVLTLVAFLYVCFSGLTRAAARPSLKVIHQSGKFSVDPKVLTHALTHFAVDRKADVITLSEVSPLHFRKPLEQWAKAMGWFLYHPHDTGANECAILSRLPITKGRARQSTHLRLKVGRTAPTHLISAKIKGWGWFSVIHTPAHTLDLKPGLWPTRVYNDMIGNLHHWWITQRARFSTLLGDWNRDLTRDEVRQDWKQTFPHLPLINPKDQKGTEGARVIDGGGTSLEIRKPFLTLPIPDPPPDSGHDRLDHHPVECELGQPSSRRSRAA